MDSSAISPISASSMYTQPAVDPKQLLSEYVAEDKESLIQALGIQLGLDHNSIQALVQDAKTLVNVKSAEQNLTNLETQFKNGQISEQQFQLEFPIFQQEARAAESSALTAQNNVDHIIGSIK